MLRRMKKRELEVQRLSKKVGKWGKLSAKVEDIEHKTKSVTSGVSGIAIDKISRIAFPVTFVIFNIFYWALVLTLSANAMENSNLGFIAPAN